MNTSGEYLNYDPFADIYDRTRVIPPDTVAEIVEICARASNLRKGGLFLDAGVGTARFAATMAAAYPGRVVGVDVSSDMLAVAREKTGPGLSLARGDLQRLPFRTGAFSGILVVHILHLITEWQAVLDELRRVLGPAGVLILGAEQGGRSVLIDFYLQQARSRGISTANLGVGGLAQPIAYLRRRTPNGVLPRIEMLSGPRLTWRRQVPVRETIDILDSRAFSQMRRVDETDHRDLIDATRAYAVSTIGSLDAVENLEGRFVLYSVRTSPRGR